MKNSIAFFLLIFFSTPCLYGQDKTSGDNNPALIGIPPKTLRALSEVLEKNQTDPNNFETQLAKQVKKYEVLRTELQNHRGQEEIYQQAEALLEEGKLEEAEQLIESDFEASMKQQAYKGYIYGKTKELLLKYSEATKGYKNALDYDEDNFTYHLYYANNEYTLAHYDKAIRHYEIALGIYTLSGGNDESIATLLNNLGLVWDSKGNYDKAIDYYEKALQINMKALGENHIEVATNYNNLGSAWQSKGDYDKAIDYFEKALQIDLNAFGGQHPKVATRFNNLGSAWYSKGKYNKAIDYYEKALQIDLNAFGDQHPNVGREYNNLGGAWYSKGKYNKAIDYYEKALQIDLNAFGDQHPNVAKEYNNLGGAWYSKGKYDKAIDYYEKCQAIWDHFFEPTHPYQKATAQSLSRAADGRGMELFSIIKYQKALGYFLKALKNAQKAEDEAFSVTCHNNIGAMQKYLKLYEEGLQSLNEGLQRAEQITLGELINLALIRRMQYHKVGCLRGLKRDKEAENLAKQLWQDCVKEGDTRNIEDLKKEGYDFGR